MKIFYRTLIILVAALLFFGATFAVTQLDSVQTLISSAGSEEHGGRPGGEFPQMATGAQTDSVAVTFDATSATTEGATQTTAPTMGSRPERGNRGGSWIGIVEVLKNFLIVVSVTLIVAIPWSIAQRIRRLRRTVRLTGATGPA